ncbi:hypothetical protein F5X99DRAFT_374556 [Biscogniauxia marginata]|nr:hypothetical protein F5X99DRAFT_374556 [Biscogniauxia marginata]
MQTSGIRSLLTAVLGLEATNPQTHLLLEGFSGNLTIDRNQLVNCRAGTYDSVSESLVSIMPPVFEVSGQKDTCNESETIAFEDTCGVEGHICIPKTEIETSLSAQGGDISAQDCKRDCAIDCVYSILFPPIYGICVGICIATNCPR